ncbi:MAG: GerMN domain-containing protein [Anaerolineales bacterium]
MRRIVLLTAPIWLSLACIATTPAATQEGPAATQTGITLVHLETDSVMPGITEAAGATQAQATGTVSVWVFFTMAADENMTPVPVARAVPETDIQASLIHSTLRELLKGPTDAEKGTGLTSWFSPATAGAASSVIGEGDFFTADFAGLNTLIPNASTSAGSQMLLSQLNSTMFQFEFVQSVTYTLGGNCSAFWEWLQSGCHTVTRAEWEG